jgi:putative hydrolase of the HAD superfamily
MKPKRSPRITCLFVDVGGVLLSDGWDSQARQSAVRAFHLDGPAFEERHHMVFAAYEEGRVSIDFYLDHTVFYQKRAFTRARFKAFIFGQSKAVPGMLGCIAGVKSRHGLKVVVVSNEAQALNAHRIRAFKLGALADIFVSSCIVGLRKPDPAIFRLALGLAQVPARQVLYLEDTPLFVQVARGLGIRGIIHQGLGPTRAALAAAGLD